MVNINSILACSILDGFITILFSALWLGDKSLDSFDVKFQRLFDFGSSNLNENYLLTSKLMNSTPNRMVDIGSESYAYIQPTMLCDHPLVGVRSES